MAIAKMRKLSLVGLLSDREPLTRELLLLGCVEVSPLGTDERLKQIVSGADEAQSDYRLLTRAIDTANRRAPVKTPFLSPSPEVSAERFLDERDYAAAAAVAREIEEIESKLRHTDADDAREESSITALEPWKTYDLPLDFSGTSSAGVLLGMFPPQTPLTEIERTVYDAVPEAEIFTVSVTPDGRYAEVVYHRDREAELGDVLRSLSFAQNAPKGVRTTAGDAIRRAADKIAEHAEDRAAAGERLSELAGSMRELKLAQDLALTRTFTEENAAKLASTDATLILSGWLPVDSEKSVRALLDRFDCAYELADPEESEYPDVPILLKNNSVTAPLSMVTEMYSLPAYDGIDPNPLMAPFFILFYGLMMADIGYGLVMIILALIIKTKKKPRGGFKNFTGLLLMCGIATIGGGIITAGFFGDAPTQVASIFGKEFSMPWNALIDPMNQAIVVLAGALGLGFVQIIAGMAINFYMSCRDGRPLDAVLDNVPWWITFAGIAVLALGKMGMLGETFTGFAAFIPAIVGAVLLVCTQGRKKPSVGGKIISGLGSLYNITSYFSDVLSYARVMALMLAGGVIANVFNMIGAMTGNIVAFAAIFLIGHSLNIALNLLGNYVHDLRLQCLEYFGKFYKDGGRKFEPLEIKAKHFVVTK
ncbi:MAG: V-type ATP synthase subunit I [Oscillospiraceae bacterium]|jgi:V/A-type H+-transporting ATPase subunit I|nr:V-type ATP synthase subunit I [Oscillospiraceae bacterium]